MKTEHNVNLDLVELAKSVSCEILYPEPFIQRDYVRICELVGRQIPRDSSLSSFQEIVRSSMVVVARLVNNRIIAVGSLTPRNSLICSEYYLGPVSIDQKYKNPDIACNPIEELVIQKLAQLSRDMNLSPVNFSSGSLALLFRHHKVK
ncbi:MAG: hypothetical protein KBC33_01555 [Candidatus Pacebacteria bacterium]|nr:hypothetical protein [Candidatus Paceibacterota bacterium]